jgi:hypothetical protein
VVGAEHLKNLPRRIRMPLQPPLNDLVIRRQDGLAFDRHAPGKRFHLSIFANGIAVHPEFPRDLAMAQAPFG